MIYIYTLSDPRTGEVKYVGKTEKPLKVRFKGHLSEARCGRVTYKNNWVRSLLKEDLKPIIEIIDEYSYDDWEWLEIMWIGLFKTWGFKLTNMGEGGEGVHFTPEVRKKMSESRKAYKQPQWVRDKQGRTMRGRKRPKEVIDRIVKTRKERGWCHSEETKKMMSENRKGKKKKPYKKLYIAVDQYTKDGVFIKTWESVTSILNEYPNCKVSECMAGTRKTSMGYIWKRHAN